ncbi:MAG TPA: metallophosphoesterase [Candidatus Acidoferrales bacterium]|jgi:3',5'-cyclic AMP phosphodiesterase CpdA|nr:metallophosphoesterase [Candidatus Acidoferrales bacterium]
MDRRTFLQGLAGAGALIAMGASGAHAEPALESFDFVFFTDTHIEPELNAPRGCDQCFRKIARIKSDFAIMGGDHVYDALSVVPARASLVYDLYRETEQQLRMKLYHVIGNHDLFGIETKSGVSTNDPAYGKKMYEERIGGRTYYSFDHRGYHFVVLDSIQPTADRQWEARIDDPQVSWLADDLKGLRPGAPVIVITHVPLVTAFTTYAQLDEPGAKYNTLTVANTPQVLKVLEGHNVIAVLQGHTHVNEIVSYKNTQYITSGAVCGNWWHGPRMGTPEGFTVVSLREGKISTRYETYGFRSIDPRAKF